MESNKNLNDEHMDLFMRYDEEISEACRRAVREALRKHKQAGNPIAVFQDGKVVLLQPDEIEID